MIEARGLGLEYRSGAERVPALADVDLKVPAGEFVALVGPSGSGKTSLLNLLGALDRPASGELRVAQVDLVGASDRELARFRNRHVGFVFQSFHLDPRRTALQNVLVPLYFGPESLAKGRERGRDLLGRVGLAGLEDRPVARLSGGQRQRVAVARALIGDPELLLADEPVGQLDDATAAAVLELLSELHRERGLTLVATTHENRLVRFADRVLELEGGRIVADRPGSSA